MNGVLGRPYRVIYSSKNLVSGLMGISARVIRPDDVLMGIFPMIEFSDPGSQGVYYLDLMTTQLLPEGEYSVVINENGLKTIAKVSMTLPQESSSSEDITAIEIIAKVIDDPIIMGRILGDQPVIGKLSSDEITGRVDSIGQQLKVSIMSEAIKGIIKECL